MPLPPALHVDHRCRSSAFDAETTWSLDGMALVLRSAEGATLRSIPLAAIRAMNLRFDPTRMQPNRYRCHLVLLDGGRLAFQNEHYLGLASFEDRSHSYSILVRVLAHRLPVANPACSFTTGTSGLSWWAQMIGLGILFAGLALLLLLMFAVISWLVIVKLVLIAFFLPVLWRWAVKNRPVKFDPRSPPPELLPGRPGPLA